MNEEVRSYLDELDEDEDVLRSSKERVDRESETARIHRLQAKSGKRLIIQGGDLRQFSDEVIWRSR